MSSGTAWHEQARLRFACTGCGACCSGGPDHHVYLTRREADAVCRHLGLSTAWFRRRYLRRSDEGELVLNNLGGGPCLFLRKDNTCRIYPVRPVQCRTYPFWPELMNRRAWRREAARCEGLDRGTVVPLARIRAALARHKKTDG